jgi:hypothetical protein
MSIPARRISPLILARQRALAPNTLLIEQRKHAFIWDAQRVIFNRGWPGLKYRTGA